MLPRTVCARVCFTLALFVVPLVGLPQSGRVILINPIATEVVVRAQCNSARVVLYEGSADTQTDYKL